MPVTRRQVWKYALPLDFNNDTVVKLPADHSIVHVGYDPKTGLPTLWIEVPTVPEADSYDVLGPIQSEAQKAWAHATDQTFRVVPTGADIPAPQRGHRHRSWDSYVNRDPITTNPLDRHEFAGRSDRWCEICNLPDRANAHDLLANQSTPEVAAAFTAQAEYLHIGTSIDTNFGYVFHVYQLFGN